MGDHELYEILEVSRGASDGDIRRAYHRLAKVYHPDKNPGADGEDKFKSIQSAYEILSDPQKRELYDRYGMDAFKDGMGDGGGFDGFPGLFFGGGGGGGDIFSHFFEGGLFGGQSRRQRKSEPLMFPLEVTLEELYNGETKSVEYKKKSLCKPCRGSGSKSGQSTTCRKCRGSGIQVIHKPIGPNMLQQIRAQCTDCGGTGDFVKTKDRCSKCKGQRMYEEDITLEVPVSPGMKHGQKLPFRGKGDEMPEMEAGDVIVVIQETDHVTFNRQGIDLFVEKEIELVDALCGFTIYIEHLDGRKLALQNPPGQVIYPGCVRGIQGEGMPQFRHPDIKGNLYVKFNVKFPEDNFADEKTLSLIENLLPTKTNSLNIDDEVEEVHLHEYDATKGVINSHDDDDEDMDGSGHPGMRCAQQ